MRILAMLPAAPGVFPAAGEEKRISIIRSYSTAATQIDVGYLPPGSGFNPLGGGGDLVALARAGALAAQRALQAESDGYDAFLPFGTVDCGVSEARKVTKTMIVVGQAESTMLFCGLLDRPFATVSFQSHGGRDYEQMRQRGVNVGVEHLMVSNTAIEIPNAEYPARREELMERFILCAREAKGQGAEMIGVVGMSICPVEYSANELTDACGLPVLDAMACQVGMAEWWHRVGLPLGLLRVPRAAA